jgi:GNAT superfamily N-acetyltransferase
MTVPPGFPTNEYKIEIADLERDEVEIIEFWLSHFPDWKVSKYQYFYVDNPDGQAICWLVRDTRNNQLVGTLAMLMRVLYIDSEPFQAAVAADIVVHRDHRRKGLSVGLFSALSLDNSPLG